MNVGLITCALLGLNVAVASWNFAVGNIGFGAIGAGIAAFLAPTAFAIAIDWFKTP